MDQHTEKNSQKETEDSPGGHSVHPSKPGNELQGDPQPPASLLPAIVNWARTGKGLKVIARKIKMKEPVVPKTGGKQRLQEHDLQKLVFAFYYGLGATRSLGQVAQHFKKKITLIQKWSSCFDWNGRIKVLENQSIEEAFKGKAISILNLILDSLTKKDKAGKLVLASSERTAVEKLKLAVGSFKQLREDSREIQAHQREMDRGPGGHGTSGKNRVGVLVNVTIQK